MLEPDALKGARPVLRGGGGGDLTSLPDYPNPGGPSEPRRSLTIGTRAVASGIMRVEEGDRLRRGWERERRRWVSLEQPAANSL